MSKQRKVYTPEFKLEVVLEGLRDEKPIAQLCREHRCMPDGHLSHWCRPALLASRTTIA